jgi:hypothetical protein
MHRWDMEFEESKVVVDSVKVRFEKERRPMMTFLEFVNATKKSPRPGLPKLPRLPKLAKLPKLLGQGTSPKNSAPNNGHVRRTVASLIVLLRQLSRH